MSKITRPLIGAACVTVSLVLALCMIMIAFTPATATVRADVTTPNDKGIILNGLGFITSTPAYGDEPKWGNPTDSSDTNPVYMTGDREVMVGLLLQGFAVQCISDNWDVIGNTHDRIRCDIEIYVDNVLTWSAYDQHGNELYDFSGHRYWQANFFSSKGQFPSDWTIQEGKEYKIVVVVEAKY